MSWAQASPDVQVIMECFTSGQGTGDAIARMFMNQGEASVPAGRLPMTWPKDLSQVRVYSLDCLCLVPELLVLKFSSDINIR